MMSRPRGRVRAIARGAAMAGILLACCRCAFALDPALDVSQYAHTSWKIRDGFAKGAISSIAQTSDGYLWLGTELGLLRFDGVRNVPFQPPAGQHLPSSTIGELLAARDGTLWIGTDKGLASWDGSRLTDYPALAEQRVLALVEDREGSVWVGSLGIPTGRLCAIRAGRVQCHGEDGTLGRGVLSLYEDTKGNLWVGGRERLWRWKPGPPQFISLRGAVTKDGLGEDMDGALLVVTTPEYLVQRLVDGKLESYSFPKSARPLRANRTIRDRDGCLWIGTTDAGLVHVHEGRTDVFPSSDGLSGDFVTATFEDREGSIWVATTEGLDRFREFAVRTYSVKQGLLNSGVNSVLALKDGSMLFGTISGLNRWNSGRIENFAGSAAQAKRITDIPHSLFQDVRGRVWAVALRAFGYLENGRLVSVPANPGGSTRSIVEDGDENLWVADQELGLSRVQGSKVVQQIRWEELGHRDFAAAMAVDRLQGGLWLGFFNGGIAYFKGGKIQRSFGAADGLGPGRLMDLWQDADGALWASTEGGLSRLKNGRIATLNSKNGLPCDTVHWAREDDFHSLWLFMPCGLVRIARPQVDAWATASDKLQGEKQTIQTTLFDSSDGVRTHFYAIGYTPKVAKSSDGRLWFTGMNGVNMVDTRHLPFNKLPPPVHIEQIIADRKPYDAIPVLDGHLRLPPLVRDLEIDYTALSLVAPENVRFRYRLEGWDRDWQDVGNRRQAFYNNLPPRNYRFRVTACNNSGVWNEAGTFLDFSVAPAYYQTAWFRVSCVAGFLMILGALYHLRVRQVAGQVRGRMEERLEERERIARDLHDTLLQSVQGLILKFHAVAKQIPRDAAAYAALEKTLDRADEVLAEGRDRIRNLRAGSESVSDLPAAFRQIAEESIQGRRVTFKTVVEGAVRELHPLVLEESYCIGREALINALTHSEGHHVEVEITYEPRQFRLRVRDDGRGFDLGILEDGGRPGHWGLQGMRERSDRIGAQLKLWSGPETGTEVELIVPGESAYRAPHTKSWNFWFRRSSGGD